MYLAIKVMNNLLDKINLLQLTVAGTATGMYNWMTGNNVGFWISLLTGFLILLITIGKFIVVVGRDWKKWKAGTLFSDNKPNQEKESENGN